MESQKWVKDSLDLGERVQGKKLKFAFTSTKELKVSDIQAGCKCTRAKYDNHNKALIVEYTPLKVPVHLQSRGWYLTTKVIKINEENGQSSFVRFSAKILRR